MNSKNSKYLLVRVKIINTYIRSWSPSFDSLRVNSSSKFKLYLFLIVYTSL